MSVMAQNHIQKKWTNEIKWECRPWHE
jgi:hypothetical protein